MIVSLPGFFRAAYMFCYHPNNIGMTCEDADAVEPLDRHIPVSQQLTAYQLTRIYDIFRHGNRSQFPRICCHGNGWQQAQRYDSNSN